MPTRQCLRCRAKITKGSYCEPCNPYTQPGYKLVQNAAKYQHGRLCPKCAKPMLVDTKRKPTVDHIVPASMGGLDTAANLRYVCGRCHYQGHAGVDRYGQRHKGRKAYPERY